MNFSAGREPDAGSDAAIRKIFTQTATNLTAISEDGYLSRVTATIDMLVEAFQSGRKLLVYGNGGSASDAQHICAELAGRFVRERRGLPAIALTSNQSLLTAWANDYDFDSVFERQIEAFGQPGDVAWGISTSGNSPNVVRAQQKAHGCGLRTIGLTGSGGGKLAAFCDILMAVPLTDTPRIQEVHLVTYHVICAAVEERLFGDAGSAG